MTERDEKRIIYENMVIDHEPKHFWNVKEKQIQQAYIDGLMWYVYTDEEKELIAE